MSCHVISYFIIPYHITYIVSIIYDESLLVTFHLSTFQYLRTKIKIAYNKYFLSLFFPLVSRIVPANITDIVVTIEYNQPLSSMYKSDKSPSVYL